MALLALSLTAALLGANPAAIPGPEEIAAQPLTPHIYGGEESDPGAWPAVVAVRTGQLCTGTLVAPNLVLTAAHCFDPPPSPSNPVRVVFGNAAVGTDTVEAEAWGAQPEFCLPSECGDDIHDFAWVRLPGDVAIEPIVPITDQDEYLEFAASDDLTFVGFGEAEEGPAGIKREVVAPLVGFNESGREFRAGAGGKDTCQGDSGGPALVQLSSGAWRVAGVLSRGGDCGEGGIYGVPLPELCWLRDDSGVDLLPAGCETCECVTLVTGGDEDGGCNCGVEPGPDEGPWWWVLELAAVVALFAGLRLRPR